MATGKAKASPTKAFFVQMLTRDISLDDCILDLVDNSIDGAWRTSGKQPSELAVNDDLKPFAIHVEYTEERFRIWDNCGGITLDDAINYAFTFGRRRDQAESDYSVGVYGIGMKRAAFKIGEVIQIDSTYVDDTVPRGFRVSINVPDWMENESEDWDFDLEDIEPASETGVEIIITGISEETRSRFADPTYERSLRRVLARDYMVPLMRGLTLRVNSTVVQGQRLHLAESDDFAPMRDSYSDGEVNVEIMAGMSSGPPDSIDPDEVSARTDDTSGWFVICNGRVVLAADRSNLTGWGLDDFPRWHPQYSGFVGVIFFSSKKTVLLPMTTTKRSVDVSSAVYRRALPRMQAPTRTWTDYTNKRKNDELVRQLETAALPRDIASVPQRPSLTLPSVKPGPAREPVANVNYAVPRKRMLQLAAALGDRNMAYREVGQRSFDYAHENLVDEDEL